MLEFISNDDLSDYYVFANRSLYLEVLMYSEFHILENNSLIINYLNVDLNIMVYYRWRML